MPSTGLIISKCCPPRRSGDHSLNWNSDNPLPTTINHYTGYLKADAKTAEEPVTLMKPFGIGSLYDTGLIKEFEMFYCPGFRPQGDSADDKAYKHGRIYLNDRGVLY